MASKMDSPSAEYTKVPRFSVQDGFHTVYMDISQDGCRLALSGYNNNTKDTFIDLFILKNYPGSQELSLLMTSQPYFSKEFSKIEGSTWRYVCFLDDSVFLTCCVNTIESYDTKEGRLVNRHQFTGEARCMTTRDGRVYVGLEDSNDVIVFDRTLNQINTIKLKGLENDEYPRDLTVNNNKLFICTALNGRAVIYNTGGGEIEYEFKEPNKQYRRARRITVSEKNGLIYILWNSDTWGKRIVVVVYSLSGGNSSFPGGHSCLSDCHVLASFNVSDDSCIIRINDNVNRLLVVTMKTGEIYEYHPSDIINLDNLLKLIELLITTNNCQKLLKYFKIPADMSKTIQESDEPSKSLLQHLRKTDMISAGDISRLLTACNDQGISQVIDSWINYQKYPFNQKVPLHQLKQLEKQLNEKLTEEVEHARHELTDKLEEIQSEKMQLSSRLLSTEKDLQHVFDEEKRHKRIVEEKQKELEETKSSLRDAKDELVITRVKYAKESMALQEILQQTRETLSKKTSELEETKSSLRDAKDELVKAHVEYAKESMALQEVIQQTREALSKKTSTSIDSIEEEETLPQEEQDTFERSEGSVALAADYGRLMVDVAEDLTLDHTLKLAFLFQLPNSEKDMLRRISLIEAPGITLINIMKTRNIINMYDVTNLQKGLLHLYLNSTNEKYVVPYQEKIVPFQCEEDRSPVLVDWPDAKTEALKVDDTSDLHESERPEDSEEPKYDQTMPITQPYIEHRINDEGGTITLMGVCLLIPDKALSGDHVIAVTVIDDRDIFLPGTPQRGRMTPLIKLEPEGLKLKKPAKLIIPHSAIIPEPDRHSVIIFTGQPTQGDSQKGHITWTKETSVEWKLDQETISLVINTLSYVVVHLVSEEMEQKHIFRVVPFVDGILDAKDDVIITVCICKDNDAEYQLLLHDYMSKLTIRSDLTFQVCRTLNGENDGESHIRLAMSPQIDSYSLKEGEAVTKLVDIDHLCGTSRVSLQFRLQRNQSGCDEMVDVKLKVSQGQKNKIDFTIHFQVKNILLSRESQRLLNQRLQKDLFRYKNLKHTISTLLEREDCEKLATFFELTPAEWETVLNDSKPGILLVKILDERELIMPDKVFGLYEGLKASHLGRHVLEYIGESQKEKVNDKMRTQEDKREANKREDQSHENHLKITSNAKLLIDEGYKRMDVQLALKLSYWEVDLGRKILMFVENERAKKWSLERNYSSCFMQMDNIQIQISRSSGLIGPHISFQKR